MLLQQAAKYETMLNSCLIERLAQESRFMAIADLQQLILNKSASMFDQQFDRAKIQQQLAYAESAAQQTST